MYIALLGRGDPKNISINVAMWDKSSDKSNVSDNSAWDHGDWGQHGTNLCRD